VALGYEKLGHERIEGIDIIHAEWKGRDDKVTLRYALHDDALSLFYLLTCAGLALPRLFAAH
jgi:hypothetical protein